MSEGVWFSRLLESLSSSPCTYGERSTAKDYIPVSLLPVVNKWKYCKKCDFWSSIELFTDFQYGFRSSQSTADLLTVVSNKIAMAYKESGASQAAAFVISKALQT